MAEVKLFTTLSFSQPTLLTAQLNIPHHEGAGGENDFVDNEAFQKHTKRVSKRINQKRNGQKR